MKKHAELLTPKKFIQLKMPVGNTVQFHALEKVLGLKHKIAMYRRIFYMSGQNRQDEEFNIPFNEYELCYLEALLEEVKDVKS